MTKISILKCENYNYDLLYEKTNKAISLLGGIQKFIKPGERILVKPNLLGEHLPEEAVTTHPEIVRVMVRIIKSANATPIISDSPSVLNTENVYEKTGIKKIAQEEKVELINPENYLLMKFETGIDRIKEIYISKIAFDIDGIINVPKLKTHTLTTFTLGIKNLYGLIPGFIKSDYHKKAYNTKLFSELLCEIYRIVKPKIRLTFIDGIIGMDGNGPSNGRVRNFNLLLGSEDTVALDTFVYNLFNVKEIPLLKYCKQKNLGETEIKKIEVLGEKILPFKDVLLPKTHIVNFVPEIFVNLGSNFVWCKPKIINSKCKLCMKCYQICPTKTIKSKNVSGKKSLYIDWDNCISCFCCNEVCPYNSIEIRESLILNIVRKFIEIFTR